MERVAKKIHSMHILAIYEVARGAPLVTHPTPDNTNPLQKSLFSQAPTLHSRALKTSLL